MRKVVFLLLFVFILLISGCSCKKQEQQSSDYEIEEGLFSDYNFFIGIKSEFKSKYGYFTLEDFNYDNVDHFTYIAWFDKPDEGSMLIYLKKTGMDEIEKAMEHFSKLEFVKYCEKNAYGQKCVIGVNSVDMESEK